MKNIMILLIKRLKVRKNGNEEIVQVLTLNSNFSLILESVTEPWAPLCQVTAIKFCLCVGKFQYSKYGAVIDYFLVSETHIGTSRTGYVVWGSEAAWSNFLNQTSLETTGR